MRSKQKRSKSVKQRNNRPDARGRVINDVPHNGTNITVHFKAILKWDFTSHGFMAPLNSTITTLASDLGMIYKLYRYTRIKFVFQAGPAAGAPTTNKEVALTYVPALDLTPTLPHDLTDFEGPAVGYFESSRGTPYTYTIPSHVLNAMPYNWYNTSSNAPEASDRIQGFIIAKSNLEAFTEMVYADFTVEFQTLEDPDVVLLKMEETVKKQAFSEFADLKFSKRNPKEQFGRPSISCE
jgi:hypothetical protein